MADATPTGQDVVDAGVSGLGDLFRRFGGIAVDGISRVVDYEIATNYRVPDTSETAPLTDQKPAPPAPNTLTDALTALSPLQVGGLVVAAALSWALVTGKFS